MGYKTSEINTFLKLGTTVGVISFLTIGWLFVAKVDTVAETSGKIITENKNQNVSVLETSAVDKVLVKEGDYVKKGQEVALLDNANNQSNKNQIEEELKMSIVKKNEIQRLLNKFNLKLNFGSLNNEEEKKYQINTLNEYKLSQIKAEILSKELTYNSNISTIEFEIKQIRDEIVASETNIKKLENSRNSWENQSNSYEKLKNNGFVSPLMAEEKIRDAQEKIADINIQKQSITAQRSKLSQAQAKLTLAQNDFKQSLLKEHNELDLKIHSLSEEYDKAEHNIKSRTLVAPLSGFVKEISTMSSSAVMNEGATIMTIVPKDENLKAEVMVKNSDIGFIEKGQKVKLKLETYAFQKYGLIEGVVEKISPDSVENKETRQNYYPVTISLSKTYLFKDNSYYYIKPGMNVSADLIINKRTIFEYLTSPLQKTLLQSAHEK